MSLPTQGATGRVRIWRALKQAGCGSLRDGVFLLPARDETRAFFEAQAAEVMSAGGQAQVLALEVDGDQDALFRAQFDRTADYAALKTTLDTLRTKLKRRAPGPALEREWSQVRKAFATLEAIDYFPGAAHAQLKALLDEFAQQFAARIHPDEPQATAGAIARLDAQTYRGRLWATRRHLWVDRMASAWLIARFIDPEARFKWLSDPKTCPPRALGFDFDGATFTHVGHRVTFEVLLASFGLDADAALERIGGIVHFLDVGGVPVAEAAGVEMVLKGLRETAKNDEALLAAVMPLFDGLYAAFKEAC